MMRAAILYDQAFAVEDRPMPVPGPGEVLLKTRLCGICGSDLHLFKHAAEIARLGAEMGAPPQDMTGGLILGHEYVAEVAGFGPDTSQALAIGDRVVSIPFVLRDNAPLPIGAHVDVAGAYAQYFLGTEMLLLKVPDAVPDAAAALVEPLAIAVHAVAKSPLTGDSHAVVVQGCGPIGLAVAAVLRMQGVSTIVAADFSERRRALAEAMGATRTVDPRTGNGFADLPAGRPVLVFDCTGAKGVLARTIRDAPAGCHIVVAGIAPGEETISPTIAIAKEMAIQFVIYYTPDEFAAALAAIAAGKLDWQPLVTATIGLDDVAAMFETLASPDAHAKVMIDPWRN